MNMNAIHRKVKLREGTETKCSKSPLQGVPTLIDRWKSYSSDLTLTESKCVRNCHQMSIKDEQRWLISSHIPGCIRFTDKAHFWLDGHATNSHNP